jgi:hypothetical protein
MKKQHRKQQGFSHHFILPVLAFIAVGAIGGYVISKSSAASITSKDVVYSVFPDAGGNAEDFKFYHYSATGTTQYPSTVTDVIDVSANRKWVLTKDKNNTLSAVSIDGQTVTYPYTYTTNAISARYTTSNKYDCTSPATTVRSALFSKTSSGVGAPSLYVALETIACENGALNFGGVTHRFYAVDTGTLKTALTESLSSDSSFSWVKSTATNGSALLEINHRYRVVSASGKSLYKAASTIKNIYLSENGKKITYEKSGGFYVANSDGKKSKKIMTSYGRWLSGISPTGAYVLYHKDISKDGWKTGLYSYKISSKKSVLLDSGTETKDRGHSMVWGERWLPGQDGVYYVKEAEETKKVEIKQVNVNGKSKTTIFSSPFDAKKSVDLF